MREREREREIGLVVGTLRQVGSALVCYNFVEEREGRWTAEKWNEQRDSGGERERE